MAKRSIELRASQEVRMRLCFVHFLYDLLLGGGFLHSLQLLLVCLLSDFGLGILEGNNEIIKATALRSQQR